MIIGLVGFAGCGKGTVGDLLVKEYKFTKLAFADSVKDATAAVFGWDRALLEGDTEESRVFREKRDDFWSARLGYEMTPRYALQLMGTEAGREVFHKDIWILATERRMQGLDNVVIADVRFPNEVDFIRNAGGFVIRVIRGDDPDWFETALMQNTLSYRSFVLDSNKKTMEEMFPEIHNSEWAWIGTEFDYIIYNNGPKAELQANIKYMLKAFTGPRTSDIMKAS